MTSSRSPLVRSSCLAAGFLAAIVATSCTNKEQPKPAVTNGAAASTPGSTAAGPTATTAPSRSSPDTSVATTPGTVSIKDYAFSPSPLSLKAGTAATWTNLETDPPVEHWIKSDPGQATSFDSGKLAPNASYSFTFAAPGEYSYHCEIHDFMKGKVVVTG